jgi:uncharacterized protein YcaQ
MDLMEDMRYIQLDPTSTVAQSHLLVLWSRLGAFNPSDLDRLMWKEKKLFEGWAHRASIVMTEDYPLYLPRMKEFPPKDWVWSDRIRKWMNDNTELREFILGEIRRRGPLPSRELEDKSSVEWKHARRKWGLRPSAWSSGGSVRRMLEFMFHQGKVMVAGRQGRQKLWGLPEKCLPDWTPMDELSESEVEYDGAQKSLRALGVGTPKQISWHFLIGRYPNMKATLRRLISDSKVAPVKLFDPPQSRGPMFIHTSDIPFTERLERGDWEPRTTLLSPFDNLVTDRDRAMELFDFFYRIEIYTPKAQRKHGFFVLPILDGDKLVGRVDPTMDREGRKLTINAVYAEPKAPEGRAVAGRIREAIEDLGGFLGAEEAVYTRRVPEIWKSALK